MYALHALHYKDRIMPLIIIQTKQKHPLKKGLNVQL